MDLARLLGNTKKGLLMDIQFTLNITPTLLEQILASGIVIAMLVTLAVVVRRFIGE